MADHLEEIFDARSQLVAWASHDLRAPVTSLQAMLEAIEDGVVEPEHYLEALQGQVRLLGALVEDLFELANIDGGASLELVPVDLGALATACGPAIRARGAGPRASTCAAWSAPSPPWATAPPRRSSGCSPTWSPTPCATPRRAGQVTVSVTGAAGVTLISVEDTGIGIDAQSAERVFEPFFRADPARTRNDQGAGLGLAIARGLIEAQGGRIWTEPPAAGGTRVCFVLPSEAGAGQALPGIGPRTPAPAADGPGHRRSGAARGPLHGAGGGQAGGGRVGP